jgi:hypothetical protein
MMGLSEYSRNNFNDGGIENHDRNMWGEMWRWLNGNRKEQSDLT